jgi:2,4-dienoyl-CoA reductase (NADPH2)
MRPGEQKYPHIYSPGRIGKLETKNRIKYASTETNFNTRDGFVTDQEVAYMEAQARGGPGIVTTQGAYTDSAGEGKGYVGMMGIWDDRYLPGLKRIADVIHKYDALACCQLMHCGRVGGVELDYCVGPSAVPQALPIFKPQREMSREQIEICIQEHIAGARRIVEAGYDMVEISGIVGYLISNFISKYTNKRTDEYGGDIDGRCRFMKEILQGIRKETGPDVPIVIRLCGEELLDDRGGNTPEESLRSIEIAEEAGIDLLSVTAGWQESAVSVITRDCPMGSWLYIAERMKQHLSVPVSMAYRLFLPEYPERAIAEGKLDFWEMCRPMIADPFIPNKIAEDRQEDIIPCIACNVCLSRLFRDQPITCTVRPSVGHEGEPEWGFYGFPPVREPGRISVIGGGPAGMQFAAVAAERGHDVTLFEKSDALGGQMKVASRGPYGDEEFIRLADYLKTQCEKRGVKVHLGKRAPIEKAGESDVVVVATGAKPVIPSVPGIEKVGVEDALAVLRGDHAAGKKVLIIGASGIGIATALYLLTRGDHAITMIDTAKKMGRDVNPSYIWRYKKKLKEGNVDMILQSSVKEITESGVTVRGPEGKENLIETDTIVTALLDSDNEIVDPLKKICDEVIVIGDALRVRRAINALSDAFRKAIEI